MNKYRNIRTQGPGLKLAKVTGGINFASQGEAKRHAELLLLEKAGVIKELRIQPKFEFSVNGCHICTYVGDFYYVENRVELGQVKTIAVVEDYKGMETQVYKIKKKMMKAFHNIEITEIKASRK